MIQDATPIVVHVESDIVTGSEKDDFEEYRTTRKSLSALICLIRSHRNYNQTALGKIVGADQPKMSQILNLEVEGFSLQRLCRYLECLKYNLNLKICLNEEVASIDLNDLGNKEKVRTVKQQLSKIISDEINRRGLKQSKAATLIGADQPKVCRLKKNNVPGFSLEKLFSFITKLNFSIMLQVHNPTEEIPKRAFDMAANKVRVKFKRSTRYGAFIMNMEDIKSEEKDNIATTSMYIKSHDSRRNSGNDVTMPSQQN